MKNVLKSRTVWGILLAASAALGLPGQAAPAESKTNVDAVVQIVGLLLALYGRWKAGGLSVMPVQTPAPPA